MARRRRKNSRRKKEVSKIPRMAVFMPKLVVVALIAAAAMFINRAVFFSDLFTVDSVSLVWHDKFGVISQGDYSALAGAGKGRNIFKLDIKDMSRKILSDYNEFEKCAIERSFPDELIINLYARQPEAQIECGKFYLISRDSVILSKPSKTAAAGLPIITGIGWRPPSKVGERYDSSKVNRVLKLINAVKMSGLTDSHSLDSVDISDYSNLRFIIDGGLEVKIGHKNFRDRLLLLNETLSSTYVNKDDLEYIDLRFDDIVFGTK